MYIDVHCHIDVYSDAKIPEIVERARENGVGVIINSGVNLKSNRKTLELDRKYDEIKASLGVYPTDCLRMSNDELDDEIKFIRDNKEHIVAIGEVGLDLKESGIETLEKQKENFRKFISLGMELDMPIIVHSRQGEKEAVEVLEEMKAKKVVMHCFFGGKKLIRRILDNGWYLTVSTCVGYNKEMQELVEIANIDKLLCETDSPFMHPDKKRNNEPALVVKAYEKLSKIKNIELQEAVDIIKKTHVKLFD